jgi:hypothetical protein
VDTELLNHSPEVAEATPTVEVPAPTAWPIVLAFGVALLWAGLVTGVAVSILGAAVSVAGAVGWFREVLPHEQLESMQVDPHVPAVSTSRHRIDRVPAAPDRPRAWLPVEIYPVSAGLRGGIAGGVAMAVLAMLYGIVRQRSIWYPINLLAAGFFPATVRQPLVDLTAFHPTMFVIAVAIHLVISVLVGLLYGATLPMLPRRPILLGGFIAPILWSGMVHSVLGIVNPVLNRQIDWLWFVISQMGFGIVAGIVVSHHERIHTWQRQPFYIRAGIEHSGMQDRDEERGPR